VVVDLTANNSLVLRFLVGMTDVPCSVMIFVPFQPVDKSRGSVIL
jgi:hypothetical protein